MRRELTAILFSVLAVHGSACSTPNADLELDAARNALADARSIGGKACGQAKDAFKAAEEALAAAETLAIEEDWENAKAKAQEAEALAKQARSTAAKGCDEKPVAEETPDLNQGQTEDVSGSMKLGGVEHVIYFDYNEANIREDGKAILAKVASSLSADPKINLEVEGHCDLRGSTEYNLHLGERRAKAVEKYLLTQGVAPQRLNIISYGEERPLDLGDSDSSHQRNRRAEIHKR